MYIIFLILMMRCWYWSNEMFRKMKSIKILNKRRQNYILLLLWYFLFYSQHSFNVSDHSETLKKKENEFPFIKRAVQPSMAERKLLHESNFVSRTFPKLMPSCKGPQGAACNRGDTRWSRSCPRCRDTCPHAQCSHTRTTLISLTCCPLSSPSPFQPS